MATIDDVYNVVTNATYGNQAIRNYLATTDSDTIGQKVSACEGALSDTIIDSPAYKINALFTWLGGDADHDSISTFLSLVSPVGFRQVWEGLNTIYLDFMGLSKDSIPPGEVDPNSIMMLLYNAVYRTLPQVE